MSGGKNVARGGGGDGARLHRGGPVEHAATSWTTSTAGSACRPSTRPLADAPAQRRCAGPRTSSERAAETADARLVPIALRTSATRPPRRDRRRRRPDSRRMHGVAKVYAVAAASAAADPRPAPRRRRAAGRRSSSPGALGLRARPGSRFQPPGRRRGSRRAALADWIADAANVLTWRSIVNRVWHYHFGRGIWSTRPTTSAATARRPTHPELLDWLAVEFRDNGRLAQGAAPADRARARTYRQSSADDAAAGEDRRRQPLPVADEPAAARRRGDPRQRAGRQRQARPDDGRPRLRACSASRTTTRRSTITPTVTKINDPRRTGGGRSTASSVRSVPNPFLECLDCADPNINTPGPQHHA